ncbi:MAG: NarK/NasA family nitrate transporter [Polyangiaceae bacterium]|nr:NarK/NasA family nitrate transporter [Polyangiaceae bacterium]
MNNSIIPSQPDVPPKAWSVLAASTLSFTVCFMVWMMFAVIGIPLKQKLGLNSTEFGWLTAMPVLTGSLIRVPLGIWTDKYGGRIVFAILMLVTVPGIWAMAWATQYWQFLVIGLFAGLAGGSFSVGTPYVARWFPKRLQGLAMGIFGAGNSGAAVNKFVAPALIAAYGLSAAPPAALAALGADKKARDALIASYGWVAVPHVYAVTMLVTVIIFWFMSASNPAHIVPKSVTVGAQLRTASDLRVLKYCQYYSFVFGGYVGLSLWLVQYYMGEYNFTLPQAGALAAVFSLPGGVLRAFGGWLSDKFGAHRTTLWVLLICCVCLIVLSIPGLTVVPFTVALFALGIFMAFGKASVFKYIGDDYPKNIGAVSGMVGLAGGLGGFVLPPMFGALLDLTHIRSTTFMLMFSIVCVSLVWMYLTEIRNTDNVAGRH